MTFSPSLRACFETPERGCVVLDQPQHHSNFLPFGNFSAAAAGLRYSRGPFSKHVLSIVLCSCLWQPVQTGAATPAEAVSRLTVADGFEFSLVASEPEIRQPVSI